MMVGWIDIELLSLCLDGQMNPLLLFKSICCKELRTKTIITISSLCRRFIDR